MQREGFLNTNTMGNLPHGVAGIHGAVLALGYHTLENLNPFFASLYDPDMYFHGIARTEIWEVLPHLFQINSFKYCAHNVFY